ncbi:heavy-metal-associated domain-containing protein [Actinosynnema sp. NPDC059335]|uniref:heavy-metal-associated domain-containing protein n=1 Tax=Actinosynnema sp. NPDC059335 TaxID=3346804 RepID=UPI00366B1BB4
MSEKQETPAAARAELEFVVRGMSCEGCAATVANAARRVRGVTEVRLDPDAATLRVLGTTDETAVKAAVGDAGYTLERV